MRKTVTTEPWPEDEVSARNCVNCHVTPPKYLTHRLKVHCAVGHQLQKQYQGVVLAGRLFPVCIGCQHFDNDWTAA